MFLAGGNRSRSGIGRDGGSFARSPDFDGPPCRRNEQVRSRGVRSSPRRVIRDGVGGTNEAGSLPLRIHRKGPVRIRFEELHEKCFQADGEERPLLVFTVGTGRPEDYSQIGIDVLA
jgi:hypothetical protein